jgi:hypothetical protein
MPHFAHLGAVSQAGMSKRGGRKTAIRARHHTSISSASNRFNLGNQVRVLPDNVHLESDLVLEKLMLDG